MMLKPFRIRSLHDTSPGVVQLSGVQYDVTIRSQPDAALSYLDDDDGETILVGSSLELQQRLDDPVQLGALPSGPASSLVEGTEGSMHTFDIKKTPDSLATWRELEAFTSCALCKATPKSPSSSDPTVIPEPPNCDTMIPHSASPSQSDQPLTLEDAIKGALQGLENHVGAFAGFLQDTSNTLRTVAESTRETDVSAIGGIIDGFKGIFSEVGKVGKAMVEAFEAEAFSQSPSVSQPIDENPTTKEAGTEMEEVEGSSNSSVVRLPRKHENIHASVEPLAEADSSAKPVASSHISLAGHLSLGEVSPIAQERQLKFNAQMFTHSMPKATGSYAQALSADVSNAPLTEQDAPRILHPIFAERQKEVVTNFPAFAKPNGLMSRVGARGPQAQSAPFAAYASLKDPWKISSNQRPGRFSDCSYCQRTQNRCRRDISGQPCQTCVLDRQSCSFIAEAVPEVPLAASTVSPPGVQYHQTYEIRGLNSDDFAAQERHHPQQLNAQQNDQVQFPRETAKTYSQPPKATTSRSILDLENLDPDFSTRYPPLISLRKSKTISSLADRSKSPFLANINPEAAISRFPSLSQIEHEARSDRRVESLGEGQDASTKRWGFAKDSQNLQQPATRPRLVIPARTTADVAPATPPKLPGAWPEPRPEADGFALPTSEESSGAFFDRMTRSRSPEPATRSFRYIPAHLRHSRTVGTPYMPRRLLEPLSVDTTYAPPNLRHSFSVDTMAPQLGRSNTVTASNPAARLTRPFDPLENARQSRDPNGLPRRSGTERYRRRPYNESFTGAGRMPWESFEHVPESERPVTARLEPRLSRRDAKLFSDNDHSSTGMGFGISDKVGDCVRQLRDMGYGNRSPHEASRLSIYAAACDGEIGDAVEMIEEDRKAGRQHKDVGDRLGVRPFNHNDRPVFGR